MIYYVDIYVNCFLYFLLFTVVDIVLLIFAYLLIIVNFLSVDDGSGGGLSNEAVIGIACGCGLIVLILLAVLGVVLFRRRKGQGEKYSLNEPIKSIYYLRIEYVDNMCELTSTTN